MSQYYPAPSGQIGKQYIITVPDGNIIVPFGNIVYLGAFNIPNPVTTLDPNVTFIAPQLLGLLAQVSSLKVTANPGALIEIGVGIDVTPNAYSEASASSADFGNGAYNAIRTSTNNGVPGNVLFPTPGGLYINPYISNFFGSQNASVAWKGYVAKAFFYI